MEYFEFYGLEPAFFIDEEALKKSYLQIQREWHPDYFVSDPATSEIAMAKTTLNNNAFKVLRSFEGRVEYILREKGLISEGEKNVLPKEFLSRMLDLNDLIEEATAGDQNAKNEASHLIADLGNTNDLAMKSLAERYPATMDMPDAAWEQMRSLFQVHRYLQRLEKNLSGVQEM